MNIFPKSLEVIRLFLNGKSDVLWEGGLESKGDYG